MEKKLLFVAPAIGYGGAEKNFIGLANYAVENGYNVFLLTESGVEDKRFVNGKIKRLFFQPTKKKNIIAQLLESVHIVNKFTRKIKPDLIISFIERWRSACIISSKITRTKCLVSERSDPYNRKGNYNKILFSIFERADGIVFQTEKARSFFSERILKKSIVIPNPVFSEDKCSRFNGEKKNIIVNVARLSIVQKRQDLLIYAFDKIKDELPNYDLYFYGDGPDGERLMDIVSELGLEDRVFFKGVTSDLESSIGQAKLFVLSSDYEGIPNAIIESMCIGTPVISTDCSPGGAAFLIENEVNGLIVPCGDVCALSEAILSLLKDENRMQKYVEEGFKIKVKLDSKKIFKKWIEFIESVLKQ